MARPNKQVKFPVWNPRDTTKERINSFDFRLRYIALRNSSGSFIQKKDVRKIILSKYNNRCVECGSEENLQIDHIVSVYMAAKKTEYIKILNTEDNLSVLCRECNSRKAPDK